MQSRRCYDLSISDIRKTVNEIDKTKKPVKILKALQPKSKRNIF